MAHNGETFKGTKFILEAFHTIIMYKHAIAYMNHSHALCCTPHPFKQTYHDFNDFSTLLLTAKCHWHIATILMVTDT